jgi:hypothetical protein
MMTIENLIGVQIHHLLMIMARRTKSMTISGC